MYSNHEFVGKQGEPCKETLFRRDGSEYVCGASWTSVLHPPDQFRHWCSTLEAGGDCMCNEDQHEESN